MTRLFRAVLVELPASWRLTLEWWPVSAFVVLAIAFGGTK